MGTDRRPRSPSTGRPSPPLEQHHESQRHLSSIDWPPTRPHGSRRQLSEHPPAEIEVVLAQTHRHLIENGFANFCEQYRISYDWLAYDIIAP